MNEHDATARTTSQQVADDLRDAFVALNAASVPPEERATFHRRLLAITTAAKRDVERAREQLARFSHDLAAAAATKNAQEDE